MSLNLPVYDQTIRNAKPKAERGKTVQAVKDRKHRHEDAVKQRVRALCVERDGDCRLAGVTRCSGESEWAHLEDRRRAKTRNLAPEIRHTTMGTAMLCALHHVQYDRHQIVIVSLGPKGADGNLTWDVPGYGVYLEFKRPEELK